MFNLRLETKDIQPEQIKISGDGAEWQIDIPAGHWTRDSLLYGMAVAMMDHLVKKGYVDPDRVGVYQR